MRFNEQLLDRIRQVGDDVMVNRYNSILKLIKNEALQDIGKLDLNNIEARMEHYFSIFKSFQELDKSDESSGYTATDSNNQESEDKQTGKFERTLSGGIIRTNKGDVQLSESVLRKTDITHGDIVKVKNGKPSPSTLQIIQKSSNSNNESRSEFNFGVVTYNESHECLVVEENVEGELLRVEDVPQFYVPNEEEIDFYDLEEGDIVDVVWYKHHTKTMKIIWKHHTKSKNSIEPTQAEKILKHKKSSTTSNVDEIEEEKGTDLLKGKHIVLLGIETSRDKFEALVHSHGGTFEGIDSSFSTTRREAAYNKADVIIAGLSHVSHEATNHAVDYAKKIGVPFSSFNGFGGGMFLLTIWDALNIDPTTIKQASSRR